MKRDFEADRLTRETFVDEVGQKAQQASNRNTQVHTIHSSNVLDHNENKTVRINVPKQIPKQTAKLTVVQNTMKKKLTPQIVQKYKTIQSDSGDAGKPRSYENDLSMMDSSS